MASIVHDPNGKKRIVFTAPDGSRKAVRMGKTSDRNAEKLKHRIEQLLDSIKYSQEWDAELSQWIEKQDASLAGKLAAVGLIPPIEERPLKMLGPFLESFLAARKGDYKPASMIAWGQVVNALKQFMGPDCSLKDVTPAKAEEFRQSMLTSDLRATTIHKRLQHARLFFSQAKRQGLVTENPFEFVRHRPGDASERRAYVPEADVLRVIKYAPNAHWKLLIAVSTDPEMPGGCF